MRDIDEVFDRLKGSAFRRRFRLGKVESEYLRARGKGEILEHASAFIARRLAPAAPEKDGKQTPFRGHPVFVAQHATATCCRGCVEKWYGIPRGRELSKAEQQHLVRAIGRWIEQQNPEDHSGPPEQGSLWG